MFQLSVQDIHPGEQAGNKEEAIRQVAAALVQAGNVAEGYVDGMLAREQQTSTFLGNGIAIPHGTTDTRDQVLKTGVQVFQFPQGVTWGEGQVAYVAIGIAASSDEHLGLLRQLTHVLSDDSVAEQLKSVTTAEELRALLMGEKQSEQLKLDNETLSLDVVANSLVTLQALNAARLKEVGAVDATFVARAINEQPMNLGQGIWLNDCAEGNVRSAVAVSRAATAFDVQGEVAALLVTVAMNDDQPVAVLKRLGDLLLNNKADRLLKADAATVLALLTSDDALTDDVLSAEFIVRNEHGLHARPGTMLVNTIKQFNSEITVTNLDGTGKPANGRSLMKVVALGVKKGHEGDWRSHRGRSWGGRVMSRRVATITLNPAYDLVGFCPEIERGEVNLVKTTGLHAAGKGINVAKVLKDLGIDVTVGGFLGKDNQDGFQQLFSELGIANRFQVVQGRTRINVKLTEKDGEVSDFNFSGFEVTPADWERFVNDSLSWLGQFDMVCVSGSLPTGVSPEAFTDWMTRLRSQCPCIIFDSSREALVAGLKAAPWLVKPNRRELEIWAGRKLPEMKDVIEAAHALREQGIAHVVISLGAEGALWVNASGEWIAKPPSVEVVSTVGAGDSMVGGLIYGLLMRESSEHTLRLATAVAALAVSQSNVGITDRPQLAAMMARVDLKPFN